MISASRDGNQGNPYQITGAGKTAYPSGVSAGSCSLSRQPGRNDHASGFGWAFVPEAARASAGSPIRCLVVVVIACLLGSIADILRRHADGRFTPKADIIAFNRACIWLVSDLARSARLS